MSSLIKLSVSPHIHSGRSTFRIMLDVLISLLPAAVAGTLIFGLRAAFIIALCVGFCVGFEALFNLIAKKEQTVGDLSAAVTGLILALNLPANVPLWQCAVGSLFAIVVVKCIFGGIGQNVVNPAVTARVFMLVAFGSMAVPAFPVDSVATATPLASETSTDLLTLFLGNHGGAIGETCTLALIIGGIYLVARRVITVHIPLAFIGTVFLFSFLMEGFDPIAALALTMSGGVFLGAIFMATDYVTSPSAPMGKLIFGLGAGLITCLIRYFGIYPEGVSFAILLMNIVAPYISIWTRKKVFATGGNDND